MYYIKPIDPNPITPSKAILLGLLCFIWVSTGLIGHDPWKPDEAYSFGLVYSILQSGDWLAPTLAGESYMDKPPLYYWIAALFAKTFQPVLPLHDGARLASGFFTTLTLLFIGLTGRKLYGENRGWAAIVILIGCLGILVRAHQIIADLALLSGCAMLLYGFSISRDRAIFAGILMGTGFGIGFMSKGFISPIFFIFTAAGLPIIYKNWRKRNFLTSIVTALLAALPWLTIWPLLLFYYAPQLFLEWAWTQNIGNWINHIKSGPGLDSLYYLQNLPWLAWPALPLAMWVTWKSRKKLDIRDDLQLPLISFSVMFIALSLSSKIEEINALPMLLPISLLATASLSTLKRGAANALDWFGLMTFALIAILMWWGWAGLLLDNQAGITLWLKNYQPGFTPELHITAFVLAIAASVLWIIMVWRTGRSMRRSTLNWASGVTLIWVLAMTLWLPWLDSGKSYRGMVESLNRTLPKHYNCIAGENLNKGQRAMLYYFGAITTQRDQQQRCNFRLIQGNKLSKPFFDDSRWKLIWEGGRKGKQHEYYRLYHRKPD